MIENGPPLRWSSPGGEPALPSSIKAPARRLTIGIGCSTGADPAEALALLRSTLAAADLAGEKVALVASIDTKAGEPAIRAVAAALGAPARFFDAATLEAETPRLATPSEGVFRRTGCHGVAEGAALAAAGARASLIVPRRQSARVTLAVAVATQETETTETEETGRAADTAGEETR